MHEQLGGEMDRIARWVEGACRVHALPSHTTRPTRPRFTRQDARGSLVKKSFRACDTAQAMMHEILCWWGLNSVCSPSLYPEGEGLRLKLATLYLSHPEAI